MTAEESLIWRQRILTLPDGVVTSASSPTASVRLLMSARRSFAPPERPFNLKEVAEKAGATALVAMGTAERVESGKNGSLTGPLVTSKTESGIVSSGGAALVVAVVVAAGADGAACARAASIEQAATTTIASRKIRER